MDEPCTFITGQTTSYSGECFRAFSKHSKAYSSNTEATTYHSPPLCMCHGGPYQISTCITGSCRQLRIATPSYLWRSPPSPAPHSLMAYLGEPACTAGL